MYQENLRRKNQSDLDLRYNNLLILIVYYGKEKIIRN